jgi:hypothetical protein
MTRTDEQRRKAVEYLDRHPEQREKQRIRARAAAAVKRANDAGYQHRINVYLELVDMQGGEFCLICGESPTFRRLEVDHDHGTDEIRGLLCNKCNRMLGAANDRPDILQRGIEYLSRPRTGRYYAELSAVPTSIRYTKREDAA